MADLEGFNFDFDLPPLPTKVSEPEDPLLSDRRYIAPSADINTTDILSAPDSAEGFISSQTGTYTPASSMNDILSAPDAVSDYMPVPEVTPIAQKPTYNTADILSAPDSESSTPKLFDPFKDELPDFPMINTAARTQREQTETPAYSYEPTASQTPVAPVEDPFYSAPSTPAYTPVQTPASTPVSTPASTPASMGMGGIDVGKKSVTTPASAMGMGGIDVGKKSVTTPASAMGMGGIDVGKKPVTTPASAMGMGGIDVGKKSVTTPASAGGFDLSKVPVSTPASSHSGIPVSTPASTPAGIPASVAAAPVVNVPDTTSDAALKREGGNGYINEDDEYNTEGGLENVDVSKVTLTEMNLTSDGKSTTAMEAALKAQAAADQLEMDVKERPVMDEMSNEYASVQERLNDVDFTQKEKLDEDERMALRNRLSEEINKRPKGFSQAESQAIYTNLVAEKRLGRAKKGLIIALGIMIVGIAAALFEFAVLSDFFKNGFTDFSETGYDNVRDWVFEYVAGFTLIAALLLMVKSKAIKILSTVLFELNTLGIAACAAFYVLDPVCYRSDAFHGQIVSYLIAMVLCAIVCFFLRTSALLDIYYTTDSEGKEKIYMER